MSTERESLRAKQSQIEDASRRAAIYALTASSSNGPQSKDSLFSPIEVCASTEITLLKLRRLHFLEYWGFTHHTRQSHARRQPSLRAEAAGGTVSGGEFCIRTEPSQPG